MTAPPAATAATATAAVTEHRDAPVVLDLISHTDFAGAIRATPDTPGAALLAAYLEHFRSANPGGTVALDAGDIVIGAPITTLTDGEPVVEVLNLLGYDALTLGNHELDHGPDHARRVLAAATFPLLCANIVFKRDGELLDFVRPYVIVERHGVRLAVIGVTTAYTPFMMMRESFDTIEMRDPAAVCAELIPQLRAAERADVVVVLGHLPGTVDADGTCHGELFEVADELERRGCRVDVLFGGHNPGHVVVTRGATSINKTGFSARAIGHVRIAVDRSAGTVETLQNQIVDLVANPLRLTPDPTIAAAVEVAIAPFAPLLDEVLGVADEQLVVRSRGEFALGDFFTDCMREALDVQIAFMNSTSCFGVIEPGPITVETVMSAMCFDEALQRGVMTGAQLYALFELTYDDDHRAVNGDVQVSGLSVVVDTRRPIGARVVSLELADGTAIDPAADYTVVTSSYLADGGNGYGELLAATAWERTEVRTHALFIHRLRGRRLDAATDSRLVDLGDATTAEARH